MPLVPCLLCSPAGNSDGDSGSGEVAVECTTNGTTTTTTTADETARIEENGESNTAKSVFNDEQTVNEERPDEITNIQSSSNSYEQGEGIRQHLIEAHAKFVAKAFLYPDLSSSIHYWLMACVEYGTPPNDPMINQIYSTTTTDGDQLIATIYDHVRVVRLGGQQPTSGTVPPRIDAAVVAGTALLAGWLTGCSAASWSDRRGREELAGRCRSGY